MSTEVEFETEIKWVDIDSLKAQKDNPNYVPSETMDAIMDDIKQFKFDGAIEVNKKNVIINGEHRWKALKALGAKKIPVIVKDVTDDETKILTIRRNREHGYLTPMETGMNLKALTEHIPLDILSEKTAIPLKEMMILTNLKYDPRMQPTESESTVISWSRVELLVGSLATKIKESGKKYSTIFTIPKGGLIPAVLIADILGIDDVRISLSEDPHGLWVEDIYDTGKTYTGYECHKADLFACLYARKGAKTPDNVIYADRTLGSEYVVFPWDKQDYKRQVGKTIE